MNRRINKADALTSPDNRKWMRRLKDSRGMTMGELLVVVAIIVILSGVAFIGVVNHQRSLAQLERDNTAKELFMVAQNHLTAAEVEGYPGLTSYKDLKKDTTKEGIENIQKENGHRDNNDPDNNDPDNNDPDNNDPDNSDPDNSDPDDVYYIVVNNGTTDGFGDAMLSLMLPQFSIDETVRGGGSYIIRYQRTTGRIMDVFYCSRDGSKYGHDLTSGDYSTVLGLMDSDGTDNKSNRRNWNGAVLGWYGSEDAKDSSGSLDEPKLTIRNAERLEAVVSNVSTDSGTETKLEVKGVTSGAKKTLSVTVDSNGTSAPIVLDDITTAGKHFIRLFPYDEKDNAKKYIPGENLKVRVVVTKGGQKRYSATKTTNSLFWDVEKSGATGNTNIAYINNIRHLENLDEDVSGWASGTSDKLSIQKIVQTDNLIWKTKEATDNKSFLGKIGSSAKIISVGDSELTKPGCYYPVKLSGVSYNGECHSISNIKVDTSGNAGLFNKLDVTAVSDLELIDFEIKGEGGNAGALAGTFTGIESTLAVDKKSDPTTIRNVVAHNSSQDKDISNPDDNEPETKIIEGTASVGGLIGLVEKASSNESAGNVEIKDCAAAMTVKGGTKAGGLIGSFAIAGKVTQCYAGGHTDSGEFYTHYEQDKDGHKAGDRKGAIYNVTGDTAGGLIGSFGGTSIVNSYSTCSVSGTNAGGFVGTATTGTISSCYCAGMVKTKEIESDGDHDTNSTIGAFAGSMSASAEKCNYYMILNEVLKKDGNNDFDHFLGAVGDSSEAVSGINAFDDQDNTISPARSATDNYELFVKARNTWAPANAYDSATRKYYKLKFNLRTVDQLPVIAGPKTEDGEDPDNKKEQPTSSNSDGNQTGIAGLSGENVLYGTGTQPNSGNAAADTNKVRFVGTHYGDWPAPEVFIINKKN